MINSSGNLKLKIISTQTGCYWREDTFTGSSLMELFPICETARSRGVDLHHLATSISNGNDDNLSPAYPSLLLDLQPSKAFHQYRYQTWLSEPYGDQWFQHSWNIRWILEQHKLSWPPYNDLPHGFLTPANLHLPWQTPVSIQWMKLRTPEILTAIVHSEEIAAQTYGCYFINLQCWAGQLKSRRLSTLMVSPPLCQCLLKSLWSLEPYLWIKKENKERI